MFEKWLDFITYRVWRFIFRFIIGIIFFIFPNLSIILRRDSIIFFPNLSIIILRGIFIFWLPYFIIIRGFIFIFCQFYFCIICFFLISRFRNISNEFRVIIYINIIQVIITFWFILSNINFGRINNFIFNKLRIILNINRIINNLFRSNKLRNGFNII